MLEGGGCSQLLEHLLRPLAIAHRFLQPIPPAQHVHPGVHRLPNMQVHLLHNLRKQVLRRLGHTCRHHHTLRGLFGRLGRLRWDVGPNDVCLLDRTCATRLRAPLWRWNWLRTTSARGSPCEQQGGAISRRPGGGVRASRRCLTLRWRGCICSVSNCCGPCILGGSLPVHCESPPSRACDNRRCRRHLHLIHRPSAVGVTFFEVAGEGRRRLQPARQALGEDLLPRVQLGGRHGSVAMFRAQRIRPIEGHNKRFLDELEQSVRGHHELRRRRRRFAAVQDHSPEVELKIEYTEPAFNALLFFSLVLENAVVNQRQELRIVQAVRRAVGVAKLDHAVDKMLLHLRLRSSHETVRQM
mmetsp:Transcript_65510/g.150023  ORF Transcript_65510/g.150023 Transcript_65510/m.150023 type:complete len:355 (-) Transcript_65510:98-1162(-)